jgi:hypothetical protein
LLLRLQAGKLRRLQLLQLSGTQVPDAVTQCSCNMPHIEARLWVWGVKGGQVLQACTKRETSAEWQGAGMDAPNQSSRLLAAHASFAVCAWACFEVYTCSALHGKNQQRTSLMTSLSRGCSLHLNRPLLLTGLLLPITLPALLPAAAAAADATVSPVPLRALLVLLL